MASERHPLGDGVYGTFDDRSLNVTLETEDGARIVLSPDALDALGQYVKKAVYKRQKPKPRGDVRASASALEYGFQQADAFKLLVTKRTGIAAEDLSCPRAKSDMTPCIARDGRLAVCEGGQNGLCVGCEHGVTTLLEQEKAKHESAG